jgi:hypothetical protein
MSFMGHIVCAQEIDSLATNLEIAADSIVVSSDPEWYVAPEIPLPLRAPKRATAAAGCPLDSVLTFNIDSVLTEVTIYGYDAAGHTTLTEVWDVYEDGSREGVSKRENGYTGSTQTMMAVYDWDANAHDWKGTQKTEYTYSGSKITSNTSFIWLNTWVEDIKFTYAYDAAGNEIEYYEYNRNTTTNQLEKTKGRVQEWNDKNIKTKEILYTAFVNNQPTEGTWKEQHFDANGNKILDMYYPSMENGNWVGESKEEWAYADTVLTMNATYEWGEGDWVGLQKEEWGYTDSVLTMNAHYAWQNGAWSGTLKEVWGYTGDTIILYEKYTSYKNDQWAGGTREQWTYENGKKTYYLKETLSAGNWKNSLQELWQFNGPDDAQTLHERYSWKNDEWSKTLEETNEYAGDNLIRTENYKWVNGEKIGTKYITNTWTVISGVSKKTSYYIYAWEDNGWVDDKKETWSYQGPTNQLTLHEKYEWENSDWTITLQDSTTYTGKNITKKENYERIGGVWTGKLKEEYEYTNGKKTQTITYAWENNAWVNSNKEVWAYNTGKKEILHEKYEWTDGDWLLMVQENTAYNGNTTTIENYERQNGDLVGTKKEENTVVGGKPTQTIIYAWANGWVNNSKETWAYDANKQLTAHELSEWDGSAWIGVEKQGYTYDGTTKTQELIYQWYGNDWIYQSQENWAYESGRQTLHEKYGWNGMEWIPMEREIADFDAAGNQTLIENYVLTTDGWTGLIKEEYTFDGSIKTSTVRYEWVDTEWVYSTQNEIGYRDGNTEVSAATYVWNGSAWRGTGELTFTTYDDSNRVIELLKKNWSPAAVDWANATRTRTTYNTDGVIIMTHNANWDGTKWVMSSMTKTDFIIDEEGRTLLKVSWKCSADSIWKGVQKDTTAYTATGEKLYEACFTAWKSNKWSYGNNSYEVTYVYDSQGNLISQMRYRWRNSSWQGQYWYEYKYDEQGRQTMYAYYNGWSNIYNNWEGNSKQENTYHSNGKISQQIVYGAYDSKNKKWIPTFKYLYTYDEQGRDIEQIAQVYVDPNWISTNRSIQEYSGNKLVKSNTYIWKNNQWVLSTRNEQYYDDDAQAKLRREITGAWNNGELASFADNHHSYACDIHYYTIRFVNEDGSLLKAENVAEGHMPSYTGETPVKSATAQYTYTFKAWTPALATVTGPATYTAEYDSTVNSYLISFVNGEETLQSTEVPYGETPSYTGETPTKPATVQYTYTFKEWTPAIVAVTGIATYTAEFDSTVNSYLISFVNGEETLQSTEVPYGDTPSYTGETPTKAATAQYTYTFKEWSPAIEAVTGIATYIAEYDSTVNSYLISFVNGEETLQSAEVPYGDTPSYTGATPTKPATAQYTYTFKEWTPAIEAVTGIATYIAEYDSTVNAYLISFVNGEETLQSTEVPYGDTPSYTGATPTKAATAQYTYTFKEWSPAIEAVTGIATYTAEFDSTVNNYLISFVNGEETLQSSEIPYGDIPAYTGETPTKPADSQYSYTFSGWSPAVAAVTGAATYTATYTTSVRTYAIVFANYDGTELQRTEEPGGAMPAYNGLTPTKPANDQYSYKFKSWDAPIVAVTDDATYTATYDSLVRTYTVTFYFGDGMTILEQMELEYGAMPEMAQEPARLADPEFSYEFAGWEPAIAPVTADADYVAVYTATTNSYTIIFRNDDGTELQRDVLEYGILPIYAGEEPTKEEDERYTYEFAGWKPAVDIAKADAVYTATYTATKKKKQDIEDVVEAGAQATKIYIEGNIYILRAGHAYAPDGTKLY